MTLVFAGCGYTTHSVMPSGEHTLYVDNFVNEIDVTREITNQNVYYPYRPGMEANITRQVINRFILDGNYEIMEMKSAYFELSGQLVDFKREPLRYDANEYVIEYRLSVVVNMEFKDLKKGEIVWAEDNFAGESTYRTTGQFAKSEDKAAGDAIIDLARRIVERAVENW